MRVQCTRSAISTHVRSIVDWIIVSITVKVVIFTGEHVIDQF